MRDAADLKIEFANNNLGGLALGAEATMFSGQVTLRNVGLRELSLTSILSTGAPFLPANLPVGFGAQQPIVLLPGESFDLDILARAEQQGLQRSRWEFHSNDPQGPSQLSLLATGVSSEANIGNDFVSVRTPAREDSPVFRTVSDDSGNFRFFLPSIEAYEVAIFDSETGQISTFAGQTRQSGTVTRPTQRSFSASTVPDSDQDGLPDDIEAAIGTDASKTDTDGDLIDDFIELQQGTLALGEATTQTGVVGIVPLITDSISDLVVKGSVTDADQLTAYAALGFGIAVVDVSDPTLPLRLTQTRRFRNADDTLIDLGPVSSVDVDVPLQRVALGGGSRVTTVSIATLLSPNTSTETPVVSESLPQEVSALVAFEGHAYAATGRSVSTIDMLTGRLKGSLDLAAGNLTDLVREGFFLYSMDEANRLSVIELTPNGLQLRGSLVVANAGSQLFVGNDTVWASATDQLGGYSTINVSNPASPFIISGPDNGFVTGRNALAVNSSNLLAMTFDRPVGNQNGTRIRKDLHFFNTRDLSATDDLVAGIPVLDGFGHLALADGFAYVTDVAPREVGQDRNGQPIIVTDSRLSIVNYLPVDTLAQAPTIQIVPDIEDIDPETPGLQVVEGSTLRVDAQANDDVQVRSVQLIVDGVVVDTAVSFPFDLATIALPDNGSAAIEVKARATDTGGNFSESETLTVEIVPDTVGPRLLESNIDSGIVGQAFRAIELRFDQALQAATVNPDNLILRQLPAGTIVSPINVRLRFDDQVVQLTYPELQAGDYRLDIIAPAITDRSGNPLGDTPLVRGFKVTGDVTPNLLPAQKFFFDQPLRDITTADLNNDGNLDLIGVPTTRPGRVFVRFGDGQGQFGAASQFPVAKHGPNSVAISDLDGDGQLDIVTANIGSSQDLGLSVLRAVGAGNFEEAQQYSIGLKSIDYVLAVDVNDDGRQDLLGVEEFFVNVIYGAEDGTFATTQTLPVAVITATIVADLNGDSIEDIITPDLGFETSVDSISVALGQAEGSLATPASISVQGRPRAVRAADFNEDGVLDLMTINRTLNDDYELAVLLGVGNGTFGAPTHFASGASLATRNESAPDVATAFRRRQQ